MNLQTFLQERSDQLHKLSTASSLAYWNFSTTGSEEAQKEMVRLKEERAQFFSNQDDFNMLKNFKAEGTTDPLLQRQLDELYHAYLKNQIKPEIMQKIITLESETQKQFTNFRANLNGKRLSNNDISEILQTSTDSAKCEEAWLASKQIGPAVAPTILELVKLRNQAARELGYSSYYSLALEMSDLDETELFQVLDRLKEQTDEPFRQAKKRIDEGLSAKYGVKPDQLMPWHYSDPFFQEPPVSNEINLNQFFADKDTVQLSRVYYSGIGLDVEKILTRSDLYEREGKDQHAFCIHIDTVGDVRILCNMRNTEYWMNTILHELGHAVYDQCLDMSLPFLLREPAHSFTTEAVAMMFGRLARDPEWLKAIVGADPAVIDALKMQLKVQEQLALLVFIRWGLVMVYFERAMYKNPDQDLNTLWWDLVEELQMVKRPANRNNPDWAAKIHLGTVPVYYHNYILGYLAAYQIEAATQKALGINTLVDNKDIGSFLIEKIFQPGARYHWNEMLERATGSRLTPDYAVAIFS